MSSDRTVITVYNGALFVDGVKVDKVEMTLTWYDNRVWRYLAIFAGSCVVRVSLKKEFADKITWTNGAVVAVDPFDLIEGISGIAAVDWIKK